MPTYPTRATVDDSSWPLVYITLSGSPDEAQFNGVMAGLDRIIARAEVHGVIFDARTAESPPRHFRQRQTDWIKQHQAELARFSRGIAFVFQSPVMRFVLSSLLLVQSLPMPYCVCATPEEALAWLRPRLPAT